jgi:hypothetical protein
VITPTRASAAAQPHRRVPAKDRLGIRCRGRGPRVPAPLTCGASAWVAALVIMALAEVLARLSILRLRARLLPGTGSAGTDPSGTGLAYGQG